MAAMLVAMGGCLGGSLRFSLGVPLLLAALYCAAKPMWAAKVGSRVCDASHAVLLGLLALAVAGALAPKVMGPLWYIVIRRAYFVVALLVVLSWWRSSRRSAALIAGLACAAGAVHLTGIVALPDPFVDTWGWTQSCLQALAAGRHPYTLGAESIAHAAYWVGRTASTYPYMPATLLAFLPPYLAFGDYRYLGALFVPLSIVGVRAVGRRLRVEPRTVDVSCLVLLLFPHQFWVTAAGYIEPLMVLALVAFAWHVVLRPGGVAQAVVFFAIPGLKQYCVVPFFLFVAMTRETPWRVIVTAGLLVATTALPFLTWNPAATIGGMVTQMTALAEPRADASSLVAVLAASGAGQASRWLSVVTQALVGILVYSRLRGFGVGGLLLASATTLLATFLTGWQAFNNYFLFISAMYAVAAIFLAAPPGRAGFTPGVRF